MLPVAQLIPLLLSRIFLLIEDMIIKPIFTILACVIEVQGKYFAGRVYCFCQQETFLTIA